MSDREPFVFTPDPDQQGVWGVGPEELELHPDQPRNQREHAEPFESIRGHVLRPEGAPRPRTVETDAIVKKDQLKSGQEKRFDRWWKGAIGGSERRPG